MTKTYIPTPKDIKRSWHLIDAKDEILGRLSSLAAQKLIGKHKPYFTPNLDCGDYVVVINASHVKVTGKKLDQKIYHRHSGFPGGHKSITLKAQLEKDAKKVVEVSVKGMLPKNKLQTPRLRRLKVFLDDQHPYQDQLTPKPTKADK